MSSIGPIEVVSLFVFDTLSNSFPSSNPDFVWSSKTKRDWIFVEPFHEAFNETAHGATTVFAASNASPQAVFVRSGQIVSRSGNERKHTWEMGVLGPIVV